LFLAALCGYLISCNPGADKTAAGSNHEKQVFVSSDANFVVDTLADSLQIPFGMDFLPDGKLIFTERTKKTDNVSILDTATGKKTVLCNSPKVDIDGQLSFQGDIFHARRAKLAFERAAAADKRHLDPEARRISTDVQSLRFGATAID